MLPDWKAVATYYLYLWQHSPEVGWAGITNRVDHITDGGTPGLRVLCEFTRDVHPVLSPSCVAEDSRSGERFQVFLQCRGPRLQFELSSCVKSQSQEILPFWGGGVLRLTNWTMKKLPYGPLRLGSSPTCKQIQNCQWMDQITTDTNAPWSGSASLCFHFSLAEICELKVS